ncbi:MAG: hypothetical protein HY770_04565 [Chitinivibrionia bacterium]|nr:hypothetical protein [Chitinivibrionia bacterium]
MRKVSRILFAAVLLVAFCVPVLGDELPAPLERDIYPGVTNISYAGQSFRFETTVTIHVSLIPRGANLIELRFKVHQGTTTRTPVMAASPNMQIEIDWVNWNNTIFSGTPPPDGWEGLLHTESGFTEK